MWKIYIYECLLKIVENIVAYNGLFLFLPQLFQKPFAVDATAGDKELKDLNLIKKEIAESHVIVVYTCTHV